MLAKIAKRTGLKPSDLWKSADEIEMTALEETSRLSPYFPLIGVANSTCGPDLLSTCPR